jgi:hypothetical protein
VTEPTTPTFGPEERFSLLVHANSKVGKSTLSGTAPKPVLVLDAEGSWRFIPVRKVYWDPTQGGPPECDGTWDACIVSVREWGTVQLVYQWLSQYVTCFTSVVIDSITELQRRCKAALKGSEAMKIADWGVLLAQMDATIRGFRDLTLIPQLNVRCVVFIAETRRDQGGKMVPYLQGQISVSLPYFVDICGYLYPDWEMDGNGQPTREVRRLWITPHQQYEAGERVQGLLGGCITIHKPPRGQAGNDIEHWMNVVFGRNGSEVVDSLPQMQQPPGIVSTSNNGSEETS